MALMPYIILMSLGDVGVLGALGDAGILGAIYIGAFGDVRVLR